MKERMIMMVLSQVVQGILETFDEQDIKKTLDGLIDELEDYIKNTNNKYDDLLLPGVKMLRNIFDIPDLDDKTV